MMMLMMMCIFTLFKANQFWNTSIRHFFFNLISKQLHLTVLYLSRSHWIRQSLPMPVICFAHFFRCSIWWVSVRSSCVRACVASEHNWTMQALSWPTPPFINWECRVAALVMTLKPQAQWEKIMKTILTHRNGIHHLYIFLCVLGGSVHYYIHQRKIYVTTSLSRNCHYLRYLPSSDLLPQTHTHTLAPLYAL